jgi:hypothetical protein
MICREVSIKCIVEYCGYSIKADVVVLFSPLPFCLACSLYPDLPVITPCLQTPYPPCSLRSLLRGKTSLCKSHISSLSQGHDTTISLQLRSCNDKRILHTRSGMSLQSAFTCPFNALVDPWKFVASLCNLVDRITLQRVVYEQQSPFPHMVMTSVPFSAISVVYIARPFP